MGSAHVACRFWSADSVVVVNGRHVESSWTRDWTCIPCIGRKILNHWTIREVLRSVWLVSSGYFLKVSCFDRQTLTWFFGGGGGLVAQSCPTLCDPMDSIPPGSSIHGISQARILEWVAISFSGGYSQPRDQTKLFLLEIFFTVIVGISGLLAFPYAMNGTTWWW